MSDTPSVETPIQTPTASGFSTNLNTVASTAPELTKSPGLSVGLASAGGDVQGNAQAVARGTNSIADASAHQNVAAAVGGGNVLQNALDWFGNHISSTVGQYGSDVIKGAEQIGSTALNTLNAPMRTVQHEYRYLHDVEATHGPGAALLEGLGIAAGAAAGFATTGSFYGADLGAELATGAESQVFYKDSWDRTAQASYVDPNTHQQVSIGRDIISELSHMVPGLQRGSTGFKITSGLIDGIFDMNVGGTEVLGLAGAANSAEGLGGALGSYFPGKAPQTAEAFDDLLNSVSGTNVRRAFSDIAGKSAGEIASSYRPLADQDEFLNKLGNAGTQDEVAELFRSAIRSHELGFMEKLPTMSVGRIPFQAMHEYMGNSEIPGVQRLFRATSRLPTNWDDVEKVWTNKDFDPASTRDSGVLGIYRTALFTENESTAAALSQAYSDADVPGRIRIWKNLQMSTMINMSGYKGFTRDEYLDAAFDDPDVRAQWGHAMDEAIAQGMFGKGAVYGTDGTKDISVVRDTETGATHSAAITQNQTGRFEYLDLKKMRQVGRVLGDKKIAGMLGGFDEFAYDHLTAPVFKRWVLMSPSYAMHISLAELIPNALRLGPFTLIRSAVEGHMASLGMKAEDGEINAVEGTVYKVLRKIPGLDMNSRNVQYATDAILDNEGQVVPRALSSGHAYQDEIIPREVKSVSLTRRAYFDSGKTAEKLSDDFALYGTGSKQYEDAWQASLHESARDPASQMAAKTLIESSAGTHLEAIPDPEIPEAEMYHGTPREFHEGQLNPDRYQANASKNLFGPGVYTTDNPDVATTYTGKGVRGAERAGELNKTVYGLHWNGSSAPNLIDLERPAPTELRDAFRSIMGDQVFNDAAVDDISELDRLLNDNSATGVQLYNQLRETLHYAQPTSEDADILFHDIVDHLENAGFDGLRYQGGARTGNTLHEARVFFDPQNLRVDGGTAVGRTAERANTLDDAAATATNEVAAYLRSEPEEYKGFFLRSLPNITSFPAGIDRPPDMDQYDEWAAAVVKKVIGETKGVDGTLHVPLLSHIANGELADDDELSAIEPHQRPLMVKGREAVPSGDPKLQNIANWGFKRVLNPMVNFLSRQPIWMAQYIKERTLLQDAVDRGLMTDEEARVFADIRTDQRVIDNVHNLTDRTQWTETFRNWAPFYFAQEQAYRRMGRLLAEDPAAFRKYQLMITSMHNVGQIFGGKDGQGYLVIPGTGFLTAGAVSGAALLGIPVDTATPVGLGWNLSSSSVIFPLSAGFRPDVGPLLSIPVSAVAQFFPETVSPVLSADLQSTAATILGPTSTEPIYEQLVPNTILQRLLTASVPGFDQRAFNSTMMQTLATLDYEGKIPPADATYHQMQTFVDQVRWQTRVTYVMKAAVGALTPVSPELTDPVFQQFSSELTAEINSHKSIAAGFQAFLQKYPAGTPFTTAQSEGLSGTTIPSSVAAEKWINDNLDLINKYPNAGILLMPNDLSTKYNAAVYNEQIAQNLRAKLLPSEPQEFGNESVPSYIDALYIAAGNAIFYKWYGQYEQQVKGLAGTQKYDAEQAFWGNGTPGNGTIGRYAQQNPIWGNWFNSDSRESQRGQAIKQMTELLKDKPKLDSPIAQGTRSLLEGYANYEKQITTLTNDGSSGSLQTDAKDAWTSYLSDVATKYPYMINVITALFMSVNDQKSAPVNISNTSPGVFNAKKWNAAA